MKKQIKAAAIKYKKENLDVPVISALGSGEFARKIIDDALKNGIEIMADENFFEFEQLFVPGKEIPPDVYQIVAKILSYIINTNKGE